MLVRYRRPFVPFRLQHETPLPPNVDSWNEAFYRPELVAPWPYSPEVFEQIAGILKGAQEGDGRRRALLVVSAAVMFQRDVALRLRSSRHTGSPKPTSRTQIAAIRKAGQRLQRLLAELSPEAADALDNPRGPAHLLGALNDLLHDASRAERRLPKSKLGPKDKTHLDGFVWRITDIWRRAHGRKAPGFPAFREACLRMPNAPPMGEDGRKTVSRRASRVLKPAR